MKGKKGDKRWNEERLHVLYNMVQEVQGKLRVTLQNKVLPSIIVIIRSTVSMISGTVWVHASGPSVMVVVMVVSTSRPFDNGTSRTISHTCT